MFSEISDHTTMPGFALDITCIDPDDGKPWDFDKLEKRQKAVDMVRSQKPLFLIGAPMCTTWFKLQKANSHCRARCSAADAEERSVS